LVQVNANTASVGYQTHLKDLGWVNTVYDGQIGGTTGQSRRMEAIIIDLNNIDGNLNYQVHVQDYGWLGNGKNTSAAYLTGYLFGKKALSEDYDETILDIGLQPSIRGTKIYAVLKGALDAGLWVPHNESVLPDDSRIRGEHIAQYAESMDDEERNAKFANYIRCGLSPVEIQDHFDSVKNKIDEATQ
jgi:hypothetical protein